MIRNVVFDMGRVLLQFDPELFMDRENLTGGDRDLIRRELFQSAEWALMDLGDLTEETADPLILQRIPPRLQPAVHRLLFHWAEPCLPVEGMEPLLSRLKQAGYRLFLLSNASVAQPAYWQTFPLSRFFEGTLISALVGCVKPMHEIYRIFVKRFDLQPEECVFVDDATANVASALHNGWQGIVFHGDPQELEEKLLALGLRF